jgi:hypothetical protein
MFSIEVLSLTAAPLKILSLASTTSKYLHHPQQLHFNHNTTNTK